MNMTALIVTGDGAGAIIAVSLIVLGLIGIPEARPFFLGFRTVWWSVGFDSLVEASLIHSDDSPGSGKN